MVAGIEAVYLAVPLSEAEVRSGMKVVLQDRLVLLNQAYKQECFVRIIIKFCIIIHFSPMCRVSAGF